MARGEYRTAKGMRGKCPRCKSGFDKKQPHQKYCTVKCGQEARMEKHIRRTAAKMLENG